MSDTTEVLRECGRCSTSKPLSEFGKDARSGDGISYRCKECRATQRTVVRSPIKVPAVPAEARLSVRLSRSEAIQITARIRFQTEEVYSLVLEAYERQAHKALGYKTWRHYMTGEFNVGRSNAYRMLNQGIVARELSAAVGQPVHVSMIQAKVIRGHEAEVASEVAGAVESGRSLNRAVREAVERFQTPTDPLAALDELLDGPKPENDPESAENGQNGGNPAELSEIEQEQARKHRERQEAKWAKKKIRNARRAPIVVQMNGLLDYIGLQSLIDPKELAEMAWPGQFKAICRWLDTFRAVYLELHPETEDECSPSS